MGVETFKAGPNRTARAADWANGALRAIRVANKYGRGMISNIPNPPRTAVLPFLKGSQAKPKRGAKFLSVGLL